MHAGTYLATTTNAKHETREVFIEIFKVWPNDKGLTVNRWRYAGESSAYNMRTLPEIVGACFST